MARRWRAGAPTAESGTLTNSWLPVRWPVRSAASILPLMYTTCLFCHSGLGSNEEIEAFPIGRRLAFDAARGRLWVVCRRCERWNLTPLEERWEAIEECERRFRGTRLRASTDNIGLARLASGMELVRIGPALLPEIAAWRYGARMSDERARLLPTLMGTGVGALARGAAGLLARGVVRAGLSESAELRARTLGRTDAVLARTHDTEGRTIVVRYRHLGAARLHRPERDRPWRLIVEHDEGVGVVADGAGLHTAGKLLATLNAGAATAWDVDRAIARLDHAADPDGYFARVVALALRTSWGRFPDASGAAPPSGSVAERLALHLASRSFWGRGGTGSEEETALHRFPVVDRLALEMAANEDFERRALAGELELLRQAWRAAEEIAAIADRLPDAPDERWAPAGRSGA